MTGNSMCLPTNMNVVEKQVTKVRGEFKLVMKPLADPAKTNQMLHHAISDSFNISRELVSFVRIGGVRIRMYILLGGNLLTKLGDHSNSSLVGRSANNFTLMLPQSSSLRLKR